MTTAGDPNRVSARRWPVLACCLLTAAAVAAWAIRAEMAARSLLSDAKAALASDDWAAARPLLDKYVAAKPSDPEGRFRAAQAARRAGDIRAAEDHLDAAEERGWDAAGLAAERALIRAAAGDLRSVEAVLWRELADHPEEVAYVLPVLVPALMREFRWVEAAGLAEEWTRLRPNVAPAWGAKGEILERLRQKNNAVLALREAARLDPEDRRVRLSLARMLLETRQAPDEAAGHLEWLRQADSGDAAVVIQLAVCREAQGRPDDAATLLDGVIAKQPAESKAHYYRGRLELTRGQPTAAVRHLRKAAELDRSDVETLYSLFLALQQTGPPEAAAAAEERWKKADADLKRVAELAKVVAATPHDPDPRREMGELFLKNGRERDGLRWLESALRERPGHATTHQALAAHYEKAGDPALAARHRASAQGK